MHDLDETIRERRSVRGFVPHRPVPRNVICEALELAQRAPSNCNVQPWRVFVASGVGCDRLRGALRQAVTTGVAPTPDDPVDEFPGSYRRLQVDCAVALYKEMGVDRHDQAGRLRAFARNFEFFDAPHVAIVCMEQHFKLGVALDVGMYVQTLMLALWARGVASCRRRACGCIRRSSAGSCEFLNRCGFCAGCRLDTKTRQCPPTALVSAASRSRRMSRSSICEADPSAWDCFPNFGKPSLSVASGSDSAIIAVRDLHAVDDPNFLPAVHQTLILEAHHRKDKRRSRPPKATAPHQRSQVPPEYFMAGIDLQNLEDRLLDLRQRRRCHVRSLSHNRRSFRAAE